MANGLMNAHPFAWRIRPKRHALWWGALRRLTHLAIAVEAHFSAVAPSQNPAHRM